MASRQAMQLQKEASRSAPGLKDRQVVSGLGRAPRTDGGGSEQHSRRSWPHRAGAPGRRRGTKPGWEDLSVIWPGYHAHHTRGHSAVKGGGSQAKRWARPRPAGGAAEHHAQG